MPPLIRVPTASRPPEQFQAILDDQQYGWLQGLVSRSRSLLSGHVIWSVNSTAAGGGVAEMLQPLLGYSRGAGIDARWIVIEAEPEFFQVTKRIHNHLHGSPGDGGELGEAERATYEAGLAPNADELAKIVRAGDIVLLHDPQTAGLIPAMRAAGAHVVWRCHVGLDMPNDLARCAWSFLIPYVRDAHAYVFSREAFAWEGLDPAYMWVIPPSIDALSAKNQDLDDAAVRAILYSTGIIEDDPGGLPIYVRADGTPGRVDRRAEVFRDGPLPHDARLVTQVSRWDRLKDPIGVVEGFAEHVAAHQDTHLLLVGPAVEAVADDPEGAATLQEVCHRWDTLAPEIRRRVHLACLPMVDPEENAAMVNAIQRRADVVVQKSLAEGFGLTVAEGMWKGRPVVASRVGGIQDQIVDGETGLLVDPRDLAAFGAAVTKLIDDPELALRMGEAARHRVRNEFLGPRHLGQWVDLFARLVLGGGRAARGPRFPGSAVGASGRARVSGSPPPAA